MSKKELNIYFSYVEKSGNAKYNQCVPVIKQALSKYFQITSASKRGDDLKKAIEETEWLICLVNKEYLSNDKCYEEYDWAMTCRNTVLKIGLGENLRVEKGHRFYKLTCSECFSLNELSGLVELISVYAIKIGK